jgi:hypothetical protein
VRNAIVGGKEKGSVPLCISHKEAHMKSATVGHKAHRKRLRRIAIAAAQTPTPKVACGE